MMRTFAELAASEDMFSADASELGAVYWTRGVAPAARIRVFERTEDREAYVAMHEHAHLWIHRDYDHDAWHVLAVDEPREIGSDFVVMPRRVGNTLASFVALEDPAEPPSKLEVLRAVVPKLVSAAREPADRLVAEVVARRIAQPDANTIYVWGEERFYIQDLTPSRNELRAWRALAAT